MEDGRVLFDASAYMLFEASGDSEAQYFGGALMEFESDAVAEDDAQSCSYGLGSGSGGVRKVDDSRADDFRGPDFGYWCREKEEDGGCSEEEDGVVDQCCRRNAAPPPQPPPPADKPKKSMGCEDSNAKAMNDREGDRLFWEACLAS